MLEIKSIAEIVETPTRKRKRLEAKDVLSTSSSSPAQSSAACFTNAAFSSTPKKTLSRRRIAMPLATKENRNIFSSNPCFEVKSIADIAATKKIEANTTIVPTNPFEVVRKPPKKKICEDACFENPALNLDLPEKQFNPFEVVRSVSSAAPTQCFVNKALNICSKDIPSILNPYEIHRHNELGIPKEPKGVENLALSPAPAVPTSLKICLPFTPRVGCRIDFKGLPLSELTPSKLLAEKLVFSPIVPKPAKRSVDSVGEEPSMDIGRELDLYQLELENSINEAKLRKSSMEEVVNKIDIQQRVICTRTLTEISEVPEEEAEEEEQVKVEITQEKLEVIIENTVECKNHEPKPKAEEMTPTIVEEPGEGNADVAYASDEEDEAETFKAPMRFVRAYRPAAVPSIILPNPTNERILKTSESKESLHSIKSNKSDKSDDFKTRASVKNLIRKSIRKIMHPNQNSSHNGKKCEESTEAIPKDPEHKPHTIMGSIRHSLRRRPQKPTETAVTSEDEVSLAEISIVDSSERVMKFKSFEPQNEYMKIEQLTNEKKHTLRNSIRRSTRDVMRHVFHKQQHDAYATQK